MFTKNLKISVILIFIFCTISVFSVAQSQEYVGLNQSFIDLKGQVDTVRQLLVYSMLMNLVLFVWVLQRVWSSKLEKK